MIDKIMKLYLTSNGFKSENVIQRFKDILLKKSINKTSFLVISVQDKEEDVFYLEETENELKSMGVTNIDTFKLDDKHPFPNEKKNKEYDVIYVCGGNTFVYLDRIRKTGLDKFIIDSVKDNKSIYVGVSAGSIIVGPDISIAGHGSEADNNYIGLEDLRGLGLTDIVISPHYRDELKLELEEFINSHDYEIHKLSDGEAVRLEHPYKAERISIKSI